MKVDDLIPCIDWIAILSLEITEDGIKTLVFL